MCVCRVYVYDACVTGAYLLRTVYICHSATQFPQSVILYLYVVFFLHFFFFLTFIFISIWIWENLLLMFKLKAICLRTSSLIMPKMIATLWMYTHTHAYTHTASRAHALCTQHMHKLVLDGRQCRRFFRQDTCDCVARVVFCAYYMSSPVHMTYIAIHCIAKWCFCCIAISQWLWIGPNGFFSCKICLLIMEPMWHIRVT